MKCVRAGCKREAEDGYKQCLHHRRLQRERDRARRRATTADNAPMTPDEYEAMQDIQAPKQVEMTSPHARHWPCPRCGAHTGTASSKQTKVGYVRHKECTRCGYRFYTLEADGKEQFFHDTTPDKKAKHHKMHRSYQSICRAIAANLDRPPADTLQVMRRVAVAAGLRASNPERYFSE